jgi:hypothetical protein
MDSRAGEISHQIDFVNTLDATATPLIDQGKISYKCPLGPKSNVYRTANPTSYSANQTSYSFLISPGEALVDMWEEVTLSVVLAYGTPSADIATLAGSVVPRCNALDAATASITLTTGGQTLSSGQLSDFYQVLKVFEPREFNDTSRSFTPSQIDRNAGSFTAVGGTNFPGCYTVPTSSIAVAGVAVATSAALQDAFVLPYEVTYGTQSRIASVQWSAYDAAAHTNAAGAFNATYTFTVRSPVNMNIFQQYASQNAAGIFNLEGNVTYTRQFVSNLGDRLLSVLRIAGVSTVAVNAVTLTNPNLYYCTRTYAIPAPERVLYDFYDRSQFLTTNYSGNITAGTSVTIASQAISVTQIPRRIYIWAESATAGNKRCFQSDAPGFSITNLSLLFMDVAGQFSSLNGFNLNNELMLRHNAQISLNEALGYQYSPVISTGAVTNYTSHGSILCIEPQQLMGIPEDMTVGSQCSTQLQLSVSVKSTDLAYAGTPVLCILIENLYLLEIVKGGKVNIIKGPISRENLAVLRATHKYEAHLYGAGFFDNLKKIAGTASKHLGKATDLARTGLSVASAFHPGLAKHADKLSGILDKADMANGIASSFLGQGRRRHGRRHHRGGAMYLGSGKQEDDYGDSDEDEINVHFEDEQPRSILNYRR